LGAASAAMPWIGAAVAVGSMLGMFDAGGEVPGEGEARGTARDMEGGGKVKGQWNHNRDIVPSLLVPGENVINAEAAALAGHETLNRLNATGLALRKRGLTPKEIKKYGDSSK
jgi:hypothetical protein